ncbi:MAG: hypothetical protein HND47_06110 [Chloroflexi bacterium]|nr:hypothetical protein [Chloroflexota bacterium]
MILEFHRPAFPLDNFIEAFFYFEGLSPAHSLERFLPDTELVAWIKHAYEGAG